MLAETLSDPERPLRFRRQAALIVGILADGRGVALLETAIHDPDDVVRRRAVESLAAIGDRGGNVARLIAKAGSDESRFVRETAARALAALALPQAAAVLAEMAASDPAPEVRRAAEDAARTLEGGNG
jgi:HEAT repeat protein